MKLFLRDFFLTLLLGILLAAICLSAQFLTDGDYRFHFIVNVLLFTAAGYIVKQRLKHVPLLLFLLLLSLPYWGYYYTQIKATPLIVLFPIFNIIAILLGTFFKGSSAAKNVKIIALYSIATMLLGWFVIPTLSINKGKEITNQTISSFEITSVEGAKLNSKEVQGKILVVSFWATWCAPCIAELKELEKFYDQIHERHDIILMAINEDNGGDMEVTRKFLDKRKFDLPFYVDSLSTAYKAFEAYSFPALYIVDSKGNIRWLSLAFNPSDDLSAKLLLEIEKIKSN